MNQENDHEFKASLGYVCNKTHLKKVKQRKATLALRGPHCSPVAFHAGPDTDVLWEEKCWGERDAVQKRTSPQVPCWARQCPSEPLLGSSNPGSLSTLGTLSVLFIPHVAFGLYDHRVCGFFHSPFPFPS